MAISPQNIFTILLIKSFLMKRKTKTVLGIIVATSLCLTIGGMSGFITQSASPVWYAGVEKPFFTPPNWLFGPVWTTLYISMGIAAGLVWAKGSHHRWVKIALFHFAAQLIVNALWSIVFFWIKKPVHRPVGNCLVTVFNPTNNPLVFNC